MPETTVIQMYAAPTGGTENALATIDVPTDGKLMGVDWDATADLDADGETFRVELSFLATNQIATNDARGVISGVSTQFGIVTSGGNTVNLNKFVDLSPGIEMAAGERLYLHSIGTAGVAGTIRARLIFVFAEARARRMERRR